MSTKTAGIGDALRAAGKFGRSAAGMLAPLGRAGTALRPVTDTVIKTTKAAPSAAYAFGRQAATMTGQGLQQIRPVAGQALRTAGNVPPGEAVGAKNVLKMLFAPNYPGLHRPPGMEPGLRAFDKTRQAAGNALRYGGLGAAAATAPAAIGSVVHDYPTIAAETAMDGVGLHRYLNTPPERPEAVAADTIFNRTRSSLPGVAASMVGTAIGKGDQSGLQRAATGIAKDLALPELRYNMYQFRKHNPTLAGAADVMRSVTPAGLVATLAARNAGSPTPPPYAKVVGKHVLQNLPAMLASPTSQFQSPVGRLLFNNAADAVMARVRHEAAKPRDPIGAEWTIWADNWRYPGLANMPEAKRRPLIQQRLRELRAVNAQPR